MRLRDQIEAILPTNEAEALSHKQIAAKLQIPETPVNLQHISHARHSLRKFKAAAFKEHRAPRTKPYHLWWGTP